MEEDCCVSLREGNFNKKNTNNLALSFPISPSAMKAIMQPKTPPENTQKDKSVGSSQINRQLYEVLWQFYDRGYQLVSLSPLMATTTQPLQSNQHLHLLMN